MIKNLRFVKLWLCLCWLLGGSLVDVQAEIIAPARAQVSGLKPENVAVVVNELDPKSLEVGLYYLSARHIPQTNLVKVSLPLGVRNLNPETFSELRQKVFTSLSPDIQALVLVWTTPYAVSCNSITSAMTLGYDAAQCKKTCAPGRVSPYFDSSSKRPFDDFDMRISMLLPVESVEQAKELIDRGVLSAFRLNEASAYLLNTSDKNRSTRAPFFPKSGRIESKKLEVKTLNINAIQDKHDVMFYFTGLTHVPNLQSLTFMPGAIADHLTSAGGDLLGTAQMSSLRWLEAGATASYGAVSEPCNYWQKFPHPAVVMKHYLSGETAIESYWKSVLWPAQGLFIGEPLATPY
ncbi:MAG: TIGR03790 family protein [Methylophilaceae bacterium]